MRVTDPIDPRIEVWLVDTRVIAFGFEVCCDCAADWGYLLVSILILRVQMVDVDKVVLRATHPRELSRSKRRLPFLNPTENRVLLAPVTQPNAAGAKTDTDCQARGRGLWLPMSTDQLARASVYRYFLELSGLVLRPLSRMSYSSVASCSRSFAML